MAVKNLIARTLKTKLRKLKEDAKEIESENKRSQIELRKLRRTIADLTTRKSQEEKEFSSMNERSHKVKDELKNISSELSVKRKDAEEKRQEAMALAEENIEKISEAKNQLTTVMTQAQESIAALEEGKIDIPDIPTLDNEQLIEWWSKIINLFADLEDPGKTSQLTEQDITNTAIEIYREIRSRVRNNKMVFDITLESFPPIPRAMLAKTLHGLATVDRKFLRRDAAITQRKAETWTRKIAPTPALKGIFLVEPHSELMWKGEKKVMVKSKDFDVEDKQYYLVDNNKCYGIVEFKNVREIDQKEYDKLAPRHKITPEEKKKWAKTSPSWREEPYYAYDFDWVEKFKEPRDSEVPHGTQVFVAKEKLRFLDSSCRLPRVEDLTPMIWIPDFISLTGSAAYQRREPNDIDLVVKAMKKEEDMYITLDPALNLKVSRLMNKIYPEKDIHWTPSMAGPNWDNLALYDLVLVPKQKIVYREMFEPEYKEKCYDASVTITPFMFIKPLKPMSGRFKEEEYNPDSVIKVVESKKDDWYKKGIYVETKFDGDVVMAHKDKDKVMIFTSEGRDISQQLPTLTETLKVMPDSFILAGEIEHWDKGIHSPRQKTNSIIQTTKIEPEEKGVRLNVFDLLYWNGEDIHRKPFSERIKYETKIPQGENIKYSERMLVHNQKDLRNAIDYFSRKQGAEGAYLKLSDFIYELDGATRNNIKYKNTLSGDFKIVSVHKVKDANAWNYLMTLEDGTPTGRTYNTSIEAKPGDVLKVEFVELNRYEDPDTGEIWYNWWSPRVVSKREKRVAETKEMAEKLVEESGGTISKKSFPKRYLEEFKDANEEYVAWQEVPDEDRKWKGMMQFDSRGRSVHIDFRYQTDDDNLFTWTLFVPKGLSKEPKSAEEAKKMLTLEILPTVKKIMADPMKKFNGKPEKRIPAPPQVFKLDLLGGGPGKIQPRWMWNFDSFNVEFGAIKPYFVELFTDGKIADRRIVFRKLENKKEWKKTTGGIMTWMMFATKDQTPYVISRRAVTKEWIPEFNHSALPKEIRNKIPMEFQYWRIKGEEDRRKMRDDLVDAIKKKEVKLKIATDSEDMFALNLIKDIKDIKKYNPRDANNKQLADDFRITTAWYSTFHNPRKEIKYSEKEIISTCAKVVKEIRNRVKSGKMNYEFSPEKMRPRSRELYEKVLRELKKTTKSTDARLGTTSGEFKLQRQTWRGPIVVRTGPSKTTHHLLLKTKSGIEDFVTDGEPPTVGIMEKPKKKRWDAEGSIKPKTTLNSTKETPSWIEVIDDGTFRWLDSSKTLLKFEGNKLKGTYSLSKDKDSNLRTLKKE
ncbi:MAG: hypothetical protein P9X24_04625 [Candidatus Hatepunaea meridiana]|nr:hypothetical protein [Candidatus Hatepunaea meridiana]